MNNADPSHPYRHKWTPNDRIQRDTCARCSVIRRDDGLIDDAICPRAVEEVHRNRKELKDG